MLEILAALCLLGALVVLYILSKIDLKEGLLPNEFVLGFLILGFVFHLCTMLRYLSMNDMAIGALIGAGSLFTIRALANWYYKDDTLGLGDVKLMGAAGVWLGPENILIALIAGASAGTLHGLGLCASEWFKTKQRPDFTTLSLPAGPGFAVGIILAAILMLKDFPTELLS